ncbi:MAG: hypothetical protein KDI90_01020 [Alphaproteobacteria bacterium]|nr:hypothetical protein [Alphaproteobacteria bacterium]
MKKAWVISIIPFEASLFAKDVEIETLKVLSLISARKGEDYIREHLRILWYFFRMDWYGLKLSFSLDKVNESFDKKIKSQQNLVYILEQPYYLRAEKSDIIDIKILDIGEYGLVWKPHDIIEGELNNHRIVSGDVRSGSVLFLEPQFVFKR